MSERSDSESECDIGYGDSQEDVSIPDLFQTFFTNENGVNFVDVLSSMKESIDLQNKLLMKLVRSKE